MSAAALLVLLAACGQTGPLYLPGPAHAASAPRS
ncbi:MAG: lipoprotein [Thiomonas sp.]